ncbi:MAG: DUF6273 domain-containing protein [Elusimicrobiales bacterium]|nr:DUF6273 domain-containing protein [Elusimicrobiales bacterium]
MAISFEESMKNLQQQPTVRTTMALARSAAAVPASLSLEDAEAENALNVEDAAVAASDPSDTVYQRSEKYLWYEEYSDTKLSYVDGNTKSITVDPTQINLTQETNSQYIPFEMDRYYDGIDLMKMSLQIHFMNKDKDEAYAVPVNVSYSTDKIRFAWLVDNRATAVAGDVLFEIRAIGINEKGDDYIWSTKPDGKINILASLAGNGVITPSQDWTTQFIVQINERVAQAQSAAQEAQAAVSNAQTSANQAQTAASQAQNIVDNAVQELTQTLTENILSNYYTKTEVDGLLEEIDLTEVYEAINNIDGLAKFNVELDPETNILTFYNGEAVIKSVTLNLAPSAEWVTAYDAKVDSKISEALSPIQTDLDAYKETVDADLEAIHNDIDGLPQTLATDYYNKEATDTLLKNKSDKSTVNTLSTAVSAVESTANANKTSITTLGGKIADLENTIGEIDTSPRVTYEATYDEEQIYTLWEIEGEGDQEVRTPKGQFKIQGGGGSGGTSSVLKIEYVTKTPLTVTVNDKALIKFNFSGTDSSGDVVTEGTATWRVGNTIVATSTVIAGENTFDATDYLSLGTQKVMLSVTDDAGSLVTKSWTVQKIDVRLESSFNDKLTYPIGTVSFDYTPYGAISKDVHFILDGTELPKVTTTSSGIPMAYSLPSQSHGAHLLEVYITAEINGSIIESNHITKDIIWYDASSEDPVISCVQQNITAKQYDTTNIIYSVYDPQTENPKVTLAVDGETVSALTLDSNTQTWQYKTSDVGEHILTITCRNIVKTLKVVVEKLDIDIEPVTAGLAFDFNPSGRSNNDADRLWSDGDVAMTVSDNFDWMNGGYQIDENGDQYFGIKAGTSAVINYQLFADDAKRNGKEFKLVFKTTNVRKADATFLTCIDRLNSKIGLQMNVHEAYIYASAGSLYLPYSEEDIIEFEFNINKNTDIPMVMGYEDGVATRPMIYSDSHDFTQINPQVITIGSEDCDVFVYRLKTYSTSLTDTGILNNFIADARSADEMINRYNRNQIYDENNLLTPEILAEKCPQLRIIKLEAPYFTNNKSDKVSNTTIQMIYKNGDAILDNWTAYNCQHAGQGTTSNEYGAAGRNLDLIMNKSDSYFILGDGTTRTDKVSLTRDSIGVAYMNIKVNIASSENANNALLQRRYNTYNPYIRPIRQTNPKVKDTMEFYNCVVFVKESNPDLSTHREFQNTDYNFYAIGNVGDSKKTDKTRLNDPDDPQECIVEIMDNTLPNSTFPGDVEGLENLEKDPFDESMTYGWRYEPEDTQACIEAWKNFYKFVVNSTDDEFKTNLNNYFVVDSALFLYLFTTRYTMIDNRGKNLFFHYGKTGEFDSEGNPIRKWDLCFNYDNDTALGINNSGELTMTYGYEDTDYKTKDDPSTGYAFNAATSTFFCRIRDLFKDELCDMFVDRESAGAWSSEGLINQFDEWQSEFPEELWRLDIERKYLRPYRAGNTRFLNQMANGKKKYQRRQFERDQEKYMATKFFGNVAVSDQIMFRCNTPTGNVIIQPDYTLHLTPYADMYLSVMFGATYKTQVRAKAGQQYDITCPFTTMDDTAVLIYCSSQIQAIGDLSRCYIHDNDFSKASRLQELIIGNATEGYQNTFLTNLGTGNNTLLKKLDIQNTPNLAQALNLTACGNLEELYAHGSGLTGVTFADGGKIRIAELPAITSITMRNLAYLTGLDIAAFNNLTTLIVENCGTVDVQDFFAEASNINRVRITGINWTLENTDLLDRIYKMYGIDKNGYNVAQSVLAGSVHVPVMREQLLADYHAAWPDLEITYDTLINQFSVTFINDDGSILDVQYVDKGEKPVDPITRVDNPILTPTKTSTVSTDFTFAGWDTNFVNVFANQVITATYSESLRKYTVKYVSRGTVLQESIGEYGTTAFYHGDIPVYTAEESAFKYYLFDRWDQSGYINGPKTINAVYDTCEYNLGYFDGKDLSTLRPVEIYAMIKLGIESEHVELKDSITFELGHDYSFEDIEEQVLIGEKTEFTGNNYVDTGVSIFDEDRDFVLAMDYKFAADNTNTSVLAQCYQSNGSNGFRLWYNTEPKLAWGTSSVSPSAVNKREMLVIRHIKGQNGLHVYMSNLAGTESTYTELSKTRSTITNATFVLGCAKADDGAYENYAKGTVYWSKIWFADLGEEACKNLVAWPHETRTVEMCGFKKYYLSDNSSKRCSMTFLDSHLLSRDMILNDSSSNTGGWAACSLNTYLNSRLYDAMPVQWKQLVKQVQIASSIGDKSTEISTSDCYIAIPAVVEVEPTMTNEPYVYEGTSIPFLTTNQSRVCTYDDGTAGSYWLRSPNVTYSSYYYRIDDGGGLYGYYYAYNEGGVRIMFSI